MTIIKTRIIERIDITKKGVHFNVELPGRITVVSGESGTGKTFLRKAIKDDAILNEELSGVEDTVIEFSVTGNSDLNQIKNVEHKLIIIDNADILLEKYRDLVPCINSNFHNQYLILSRGETGIRTHPNYRGVLTANGKEIKAKFAGLGGVL